MTDYKHFPRVPRQALPDWMFYLAAALLVIAAYSWAGREDFRAQVVIDKQQILEHTLRAVAADEQAALHFYTLRARQ